MFNNNVLEHMKFELHFSKKTKLQVSRLLFCVGISVNKYGLHAYVIGLKTILKE
jgi:hypothetical protein